MRMRGEIVVCLSIFILILAVLGCTPRVQTIDDQDVGATAVARFGSSYRTRDGRELALNSWGPAENPSAVVLALHGMNEYSKVLNEPAQSWARDDIRTIAYDQRQILTGIGNKRSDFLPVGDFSVHIDPQL